MRFCYADPPYIGQAKKHYGCAEIDHSRLIQKLSEEFQDGWALSCSSTTLQQILPMCPSGVRIAAWVKPFAIFKPNVNPGYTWEPVVWRGGRKLGRDVITIRDWSEETEDCVRANITLKKGLSGAKPKAFCEWLIRLLGAQPEDEFVDLFPGTGIFGATWEEFRDSELAGAPF